MNKKILYLFDQNDWRSRMPVAEAARDQGYDVSIVLIGSQPEALPENFDAVFIQTPKRLTPFSLLSMIKKIRVLLRARQPDLVHTITLKYAFMTGLAAIPFKHTRKIYTLAGLGYLFRSPGTKARLMRALIAPVLKYIFKAPNVHLIFQNPDDLKLMIVKGFADPAHSTLIRGSGVDLSRFTATPEPDDGTPIVLMPTRLVHEKGVHVFVEAARLLKARGVEARFQIAGGETTHNPKAISRAQMEAMVAGGAVEWLGRVEDMPGLLASAALIVYPSYYGEGIPRVLLESCAAGRPIITTDHPGCREAVLYGENGLLVPVKDARATAQAIAKLLSDKDLRAEMGAQSRVKAETEFDINRIVQETLGVYL